MADLDQSLYNLRWNQVTNGFEGFGGGTPQWTPLVISGGVSSLNTLTGDITLAAGANITLTPSGNTISIAASGGGGSPGGSDTQIQVNSTGTFAGDPNFTWDGETFTVHSPGDSSQIQLGDNELDIYDSAGSLRCSLLASTGDVQLSVHDGFPLHIESPTSIGGLQPAASAQLDVQSTSTGFLSPRMTTTQRDAITSPAEGLEIYNLTTHKKNFYDGTAWRVVTSA